MRALRTSIFPEPGPAPLTTVVAEGDLKISAEKAAEAHRTFEPGVFVITDIFDVPDDADHTACAALAMERIDREREANMSILYYYDAEALRVVREDGGVTSTKPAPLSVEEVTTVFEQLAYHPSYKGQSVQTMAEDGTTMVSLSHGHVTHVTGR